MLQQTVTNSISFEQWQADLAHQQIQLAYAIKQDTHLSRELLVTAALWPLHSQHRYDPHSVQALLQQLAPRHSAQLYQLINTWPSDLLEAASASRQAVQQDAQLAQAFQQLTLPLASQFLEALQSRFSNTSPQVIGQIEAALVNVGGTQTIGQLNLELQDNPEARAQQQLRQAQQLCQTLPTHVVPAVNSFEIAAQSRLSRLANPYFLGRDPDLLKVAAGVKQGGATVISTGIGGIGKTSLATEFAYRYGKYFLGGVFWISLADPQNIESEIAACGERMGLFVFDEKLTLQERCERVYRAWAQPIPRLLIFDNCDHLSEQDCRSFFERYLPKGGGSRVLITSRNSQWPANLPLQQVPLGLLERADSILLLQKYRRNLSDEQANAIAQELGDLPLALTLAGRFLSKYASASYGDPAIYLQQIQAHKFNNRFLDTIDEGERNVYVTFDLSFQRLDPTKDNDALSIKLLNNTSRFVPNAQILNQLLYLTLGNYDFENEDEAIPRNDALVRLLELGLLEQDNPEHVHIHRLIAEFCHHTIPDQQAQNAVEQCFIHLLNKISSQHDQYLTIRDQLIHLQHIAKQAYEKHKDKGAAHLQRILAESLYHHHDNDTALECYQRALSIYQTLNHSVGMGISLRGIGSILQRRNDFQGALKYLQQSRTIYQALNNQHGLANTLLVISDVYRAMGEQKIAIEYCLQTKKIYESINDKLGLATILRALGDSYRLCDDRDTALTYYQQAKNLYQTLGADLGVANTLFTIGEILLFQRNIPAAHQHYQQAKGIYQRVGDKLGLATSLEGIADIYYITADYDQALAYYLQAKELNESINTRQNLANTLQSLAKLFVRRNDYDAALQYYQQAQELYPNASLGLANILNGIGEIYYLRNQLDAALNYYYQAKEICQGNSYFLGLANSYLGIGTIYRSKGELEQAQTYCQQAKELFLTTHDNFGLGNTLVAQGQIALVQQQYHQADAFLQEAIQLYQSMSDRHSIAEAIVKFGWLLFQQGRAQQAQHYFLQAAGLYTELGNNDMATNCHHVAAIDDPISFAHSIYQEGWSLYQQGQYRQAQPYFLQAAKFYSNLGLHEQVIFCQQAATIEDPKELTRQQIQTVLLRVQKQVQDALNNPSINRQELAEALEEVAQIYAKQGKSSPYYALAEQIRELIKQLNPNIDQTGNKKGLFASMGQKVKRFLSS